MNIGEWGKGITFFLFVTLLFYFLWGNVFSNVIDFVGTNFWDITGEGTSFAILKTMAWVSFILLYLGTGGVYLIYSIIQGSSGLARTQPLYFLVAIGVWTVLMPFLTFIFGLMYYMITSLSTATTGLMDTSTQGMAGNFAWLLAILMLLGLTALPFYFVLKGYGISLTGGRQ